MDTYKMTPEDYAHCLLEKSETRGDIDEGQKLEIYEQACGFIEGYRESNGNGFNRVIGAAAVYYGFQSKGEEAGIRHLRGHVGSAEYVADIMQDTLSSSCHPKVISDVANSFDYLPRKKRLSRHRR